MKLKIRPLTLTRWNDFEKLFGKSGACGGCWCMWWRIKRSDYEKNKGAGNKRKMKKLVGENSVPGVLVYSCKDVIGWCSVAPREEFPVLNNSRVLKKIDEEKVWSIVCFFIDKNFRGLGKSVDILKGVIDYVQKRNGKIIEGYPVEPKNKKMPAVFAWTGFASAFRKAGFTEAARRSDTRPIMRYYIK
ncbi:MAG: GNAT family N-acetyltransferase [Ignavibacteria bacterium]|nr:GNAT family N-acetyltransferase [Ignavibacteria bacterium]